MKNDDSRCTFEFFRRKNCSEDISKFLHKGLGLIDVYSRFTLYFQAERKSTFHKYLFSMIFDNVWQVSTVSNFKGDIRFSLFRRLFKSGIEAIIFAQCSWNLKSATIEFWSNLPKLAPSMWDSNSESPLKSINFKAHLSIRRSTVMYAKSYFESEEIWNYNFKHYITPLKHQNWIFRFWVILELDNYNWPLEMVFCSS